MLRSAGLRRGSLFFFVHSPLPTKLFIIMGFLNDFKSSLMKGDIINLATAVIVGGVFGKVVSSPVKDVIMPPIGYLTGDVNFSN